MLYIKFYFSINNILIKKVWNIKIKMMKSNKILFIHNKNIKFIESGADNISI